MARWSFGVGGKIATTIYFDEPTNACWFGSDAGDLRVFTVLGQSTRILGWMERCGLGATVCRWIDTRRGRGVR